MWTSMAQPTTRRANKSITTASYERAIDLASRLGLSPEQRLLLEVSYGRLTAAEAEQELLRVYEAAGQPELGGNNSL